VLAQKAIHVRISGHCDARGTPQYNQELGRWRAESVSRVFTSRGLTADRLEVESFGKDRLLCEENTEACHARNRRAEVEVTGGALVSTPSAD
jgi:peptidoglycan-associated lipoprotein